ncbi:MAG TPA: leucine-rich repeat protein [Verrucomicrobiae bacterium]|nr:leucine-rich repeat protein [Verrucomicrobiae bacterium]
MNPIVKRFCRTTSYLSWRIVWLLLVAGLPRVVHAQFTYTTNNGTLTVTGYNGPGGTVTIPNLANNYRVTAIAPFAFNQVDTMTNLIIGTNVGIIGTNAVYQCSALITASIPGSATNIGDGPFFDCQKLLALTMVTNAYYITTNGMLMNRSHTSLIQFPGGVGGTFILPGSVTNISLSLIGNTLSSNAVDPANTIYSATNGVLFDKNLTVLYAYPGGLGGFYNVPTNASLKIILSASFEYSPAITGVHIGTNITTIGYGAFYSCLSLTNIAVNNNNAFYFTTNGVLFDHSKSILIQYPAGLPGSYTVPSTVTNISDGAFGDSFYLTSVIIPNTVTNLGFDSFYACENLASIVIGNAVRVIGADSFFLCTNLTSVIIPGSVTNIGAYAFGGCFALSSACFQGKPPTDGGNLFYFDNLLTSILYVSGNTGWTATYDGINTAPCTTCGGTTSNLPKLAIARSGTNVILSWASSFTGYSLEYTTNLAPLSAWKTNTPAPTVINSLYVATNALSSSTRKYYRLIQ